MSDLGGPYDLIVIGSGMSGLTCANIAAKRGLKVLLCEQHQTYGGYMQRFALHKTVFDSGCHYVGAMGEGQVFDRYLRYLGVRDQINAVALDPNGFDVLRYRDRQVSIPRGYSAFVQRLAAQFPLEMKAIVTFLTQVAVEVARLPMYTLRRAADPMGRPSNPDQTLDDALTTSGIRDPILRQLLCAYCLLHFTEPKQAPFIQHALILDSFLQGAYTIDGGGHALSQALLRQFRAHGGVTKRRCLVTRISVADRKVTGIETADGAREQCQTVIAAIDPKVVMSLLPADAIRPVYRKRMSRLRPGLGGFAAYLRVNADDEEIQAISRANYFLLQGDGMDDLASDNWATKDAILPSVFMTTQSPREQRWKGPHTVVIITGMPASVWQPWQDTKTGARGDAYEQHKRRLGDKLIDVASVVIPNLRRNIVTADFATPLTHRDYTLNSDGAIYGIHHSVDQIGPRGASFRTPIHGLLMSGHSTLYPGLLGATLSAFYACAELFGLKTLHRDVRRAT